MQGDMNNGSVGTFELQPFHFVVCSNQHKVTQATLNDYVQLRTKARYPQPPRTAASISEDLSALVDRLSSKYNHWESFIRNTTQKRLETLSVEKVIQ